MAIEKKTEKKVEVKTSRAWILDFGKGLQAAVGLHEMSHVLTAPVLFDVPGTPHFCNEVIVFQQRILPVLDIPSLLEGQKVTHSSHEVVGIAVYQDNPVNPTSYGGLRLASLPHSIYVTDDQACELPSHKHYWAPPLSVACFQYDGAVIPVLNLVYLFNKTLGVY